MLRLLYQSIWSSSRPMVISSLVDTQNPLLVMAAQPNPVPPALSISQPPNGTRTGSIAGGPNETRSKIESSLTPELGCQVASRRGPRAGSSSVHTESQEVRLPVLAK